MAIPNTFRRFLGVFLAVVFFFQSTGFAQGVPDRVLPAPGQMVGLSSVVQPPVLKGVKVYANEPFRFDFIMDRGDSKDEGRGTETKKSGVTSPSTVSVSVTRDANKLIRYFLASLTVPEKDLWVNLSPYEKDRIITDEFGLTEMGRDLLEQDYLLKQLTASVIYPEGDTGKKFWAEVYQKAYAKFGTTDIPVETFNKVWIVPQKAVVYEKSAGKGPGSAVAYVVEAKLKVMLESDYLAAAKVTETETKDGNETSTVSRNSQELAKQVLREVVIPVLEKEVNEGANFSQLRQAYYSLILAAWYKRKVKGSLLSAAYVDQKKIAGVNIDDPQMSERIWAQYVEAFKKGAYNLIREEKDEFTGETIPRKYFSGGASLDMAQALTVTSALPQLPGPTDELLVRVNLSRSDRAMSRSFQGMRSDGVRKLWQILAKARAKTPGQLPKEIQGLTQEKIADKYGLSQGRVSALLRRARMETADMMRRRLALESRSADQAMKETLSEVFDKNIKQYIKDKQSDKADRVAARVKLAGMLQKAIAQKGTQNVWDVLRKFPWLGIERYPSYDQRQALSALTNGLAGTDLADLFHPEEVLFVKENSLLYDIFGRQDFWGKLLSGSSMAEKIILVTSFSGKERNMAVIYHELLHLRTFAGRAAAPERLKPAFSILDEGLVDAGVWEFMGQHLSSDEKAATLRNELGDANLEERDVVLGLISKAGPEGRAVVEHFLKTGDGSRLTEALPEWWPRFAALVRSSWMSWGLWSTENRYLLRVFLEALTTAQNARQAVTDAIQSFALFNGLFYLDGNKKIYLSRQEKLLTKISGLYVPEAGVDLERTLGLIKERAAAGSLIPQDSLQIDRQRSEAFMKRAMSDQAMAVLEVPGANEPESYRNLGLKFNASADIEVPGLAMKFRIRRDGVKDNGRYWLSELDEQGREGFSLQINGKPVYVAQPESDKRYVRRFHDNLNIYFYILAEGNSIKIINRDLNALRITGDFTVNSPRFPVGADKGIKPSGDMAQGDDLKGIKPEEWMAGDSLLHKATGRKFKIDSLTDRRMPDGKVARVAIVRMLLGKGVLGSSLQAISLTEAAGRFEVIAREPAVTQDESFSGSMTNLEVLANEIKKTAALTEDKVTDLNARAETLLTSLDEEFDLHGMSAEQVNSFIALLVKVLTSFSTQKSARDTDVLLEATGVCAVAEKSLNAILDWYQAAELPDRIVAIKDLFWQQLFAMPKGVAPKTGGLTKNAQRALGLGLPVSFQPFRGIEQIKALQQEVGQKELNLGVFQNKDGRFLTLVSVQADDEHVATMDNMTFAQGHTHGFLAPLAVSDLDTFSARHRAEEGAGSFVIALDKNSDALELAYFVPEQDKWTYLNDHGAAGQEKIFEKLIEFGLIAQPADRAMAWGSAAATAAQPDAGAEVSLKDYVRSQGNIPDDVAKLERILERARQGKLMISVGCGRAEMEWLMAKADPDLQVIGVDVFTPGPYQEYYVSIAQDFTQRKFKAQVPETSLENLVVVKGRITEILKRLNGQKVDDIMFNKPDMLVQQQMLTSIVKGEMVRYLKEGGQVLWSPFDDTVLSYSFSSSRSLSVNIFEEMGWFRRVDLEKEWHVPGPVATDFVSRYGLLSWKRGTPTPLPGSLAAARSDRAMGEDFTPEEIESLRSWQIAGTAAGNYGTTWQLTEPSGTRTATLSFLFYGFRGRTSSLRATLISEGKVALTVRIPSVLRNITPQYVLSLMASQVRAPVIPRNAPAIALLRELKDLQPMRRDYPADGAYIYVWRQKDAVLRVSRQGPRTRVSLKKGASPVVARFLPAEAFDQSWTSLADEVLKKLEQDPAMLREEGNDRAMDAQNAESSDPSTGSLTKDAQDVLDLDRFLLRPFIDGEREILKLMDAVGMKAGQKALTVGSGLDRAYLLFAAKKGVSMDVDEPDGIGRKITKDELARLQVPYASLINVDAYPESVFDAPIPDSHYDYVVLNAFFDAADEFVQRILLMKMVRVLNNKGLLMVDFLRFWQDEEVDRKLVKQLEKMGCSVVLEKRHGNARAFRITKPEDFDRRGSAEPASDRALAMDQSPADMAKAAKAVPVLNNQGEGLVQFYERMKREGQMSNTDDPRDWPVLADSPEATLKSEYETKTNQELVDILVILADRKILYFDDYNALRTGTLASFVNSLTTGRWASSLTQHHFKTPLLMLEALQAARAEGQDIDQEALLNALMYKCVIREIMRRSDSSIDNAQSVLPGGIDLNAVDGKMAVDNAGGPMLFNIDPGLLKEYQSAPGFVPVILNIEPLESLPAFLGAREAENPATFS